MITNNESGTNIHEIADGIYRINTPIALPGEVGFSFNQYLIVDDAPLLFHTGPAAAVPAGERGDRAPCCPSSDCATSGSRTSRPTSAARSIRVAGGGAAARCRCAASVAAMVSVGDYADRAPRALADGEELALGRHTMRWFDTPHVPHGWDCGY